ncbi:hypothetical protein [Paenibacillus jiagnxiensis]|uniref:hypothetical protein n=1 Tax=Paenibacillus jiagnxiensis TaxID=3228926 RepID=UPI0033B0545D
MAKIQKCRFLKSTSSNYPRLYCDHFHSAEVGMDFETRDKLKSWKTLYCQNENHTECPFYPKNIGYDPEFDDVWIVIVAMSGQDYWVRVPYRDDVNLAIGEIITTILPLPSDQLKSDRFTKDVQVEIIHSSYPDFPDVLDELQFSGKRLEDYFSNNPIPEWKK